MLDFLILAAGIVAVILGANWLVDGASSVARRFGVSDLIIGLTVVAFGTSAPELAVNIISAYKGETDIAIGNILGSNISNILLILGITSIIYPLRVQRNTKWKEIPFSLFAAVVLGLLANDYFIDKDDKGNVVSRLDGMLLLIFFLIFMLYIFRTAKQQLVIREESKPMPLWKAIGLFMVGLVALIAGGNYLVGAAVNIAVKLGMSERVIGLTIIAIGTSMPELATSVVAAYKKNADIAVGNIVGSNIFNIFLVLGATSVIRPLPFYPASNLDVIVTIVASLLLFLTTVIFGMNRLVRAEGFIFLVLYICYITYSVLV